MKTNIVENPHVTYFHFIMNHGDEVVNTKQHFYSLSSFCDLAILPFRLQFKNVTNNDDEGDLGGFPQVQQHPNKALLTRSRAYSLVSKSVAKIKIPNCTWPKTSPNN